jgi:SagB-type dehydrogenase family enzyme
LTLKQLEELLGRRRTNRTFTGEPIPASALAAILSEALRYRDHDGEQFTARGLATPTRRRSSPSGGSLQSCEAYVLARQVQDLEEGIYHYWSDQDALGRLASLPESMGFGDLAAGQMLADELSALVVITCRFDKLAWKYPHSRAYRVALMDAGHLSQTFQLLATAHGLRTWVTGMFFDWNVRSMLQIGLDSQEYPLLMLGLGTGDYCPFDRYVGRA